MFITKCFHVVRMNTQTPNLIIGIGDLHGDSSAMNGILEKLNAVYHLFDSPGKLRSDARLVFCGDLIDRGKESKKVIEAVRALKQDNENIEVLLGNHELLALAARDAFQEFHDLVHTPEDIPRFYVCTLHGMNGGVALLDNYVEEHFGNMRAGFDAMCADFSSAGKIGSWLRQRPAAVIYSLVEKDVLFVHGGIPRTFKTKEDLEKYMQDFRIHLAQASAVIGGGRKKYLSHCLVDDKSIFWERNTHYRSREEVHAQLRALGVDYAVFGHTPVKEITMYHDCLFDIDVGMSSAYGGRDPAAISFTPEGVFAIYKSQEQPLKLKDI